MKKLLSIILGALLLASPVSAQVFKTNQLVSPLNAGFIYTSGIGTSTLIASTSPFFANFTFGNATGTNSTTTDLFSTKGNFTTLCISADCKTAWPSTSAGTIATSSAETSGRIPFWTTTGATTALLSGGVAGFAWDNVLTRLTATNFSTTLSTSTSATSTNLFSTNLTATNATTTNISATNATLTSATSTNLSGTSINGFGLGSCSGTSALTFTGNTFGCAAQQQGTVTSVGLTDANSTLSIGNTPITTSGNITATLNLAHGNVWTASSTFAFLSIGLSTSTAATTTNFSATNSVITNATSTNHYATTASSTNLSSAFALFQLSTTTSATSTNLFSTNAVFTNATSTNIGSTNTTITNATTTNLFSTRGVFTAASSTSFAVTGVTSALHLGDSNGSVTAYGGVTCTNQFLRALSAAGASTCATVGASDVSLATLTATDATLTFSGSYTGATNRTIGINLGSTINVWTASTTFAFLSAGLSTTTAATSTNLFATNASFTNATTTNFAATNSTTTYATSTNSFATTASSTNLFTSKFGVASSTPSFAVSVNGAINVAENTPATSTSITVDWSTGNQQLIKIGTSATTIGFSNAIAGAHLTIVLCNPPSGTGGAVTFTGVIWPGGTAPTTTTTAKKCDIITLFSTLATTTSPQIFGGFNQNY